MRDDRSEERSENNSDSENDGDYLDPSKESDYELISKLRHGLMKSTSLVMTSGSGDDEEAGNYSELQDFNFDSMPNSNINQN